MAVGIRKDFRPLLFPQSSSYGVQFGGAAKVWAIEATGQSSLQPVDASADGFVEAKEIGDQGNVQIDACRSENEPMLSRTVPIYPGQGRRLYHVPDASFGKHSGVRIDLVADDTFQDRGKKCGLQIIVWHAADHEHRDLMGKPQTSTQPRWLPSQEVKQERHKRITARQCTVEVENCDRGHRRARNGDAAAVRGAEVGTCVFRFHECLRGGHFCRGQLIDYPSGAPSKRKTIGPAMRKPASDDRVRGSLMAVSSESVASGTTAKSGR